MRLPSGSSSSERRRSSSRPSPASTTVSRIVAVEARGRQQPQLGEHGGQHLLGLVDDQHGSRQRGVDMGLPALAQHLGAGPAVVRGQLDAEQVAHLAIEVGEAGLGPADDADLDVALSCRAARRECAA